MTELEKGILEMVQGNVSGIRRRNLWDQLAQVAGYPRISLIVRQFAVEHADLVSASMERFLEDPYRDRKEGTAE